MICNNSKIVITLFLMILALISFGQKVTIDEPIADGETPFITSIKNDFKSNLNFAVNGVSTNLDAIASVNYIVKSYISNNGNNFIEFKILLEDKRNNRSIQGFSQNVKFSENDAANDFIFSREVLNWVKEVGGYIKYYLGSGNGKWKKEVRVYLPNIEETESVKPLSVDSINADEIQDKIIYILISDPDFQNKCIAKKIEKEYNFKQEKEKYPTQAKLHFNYFILTSEESLKPIELNINVTYNVKCYRNDDPLKIGSQNNWKSKSIQEHINKNWIKAILVNQDCPK